MSVARDVRRGFARTLLFGALAALGVPAVRLLLAPVLGLPLALSLYLVGLAIVYLAWIAGSIVGRLLPQGRRDFAFEVASAALCALGTYWFLERGIL